MEGSAVAIGAGTVVLVVSLLVRAFRACAASQTRGFLDGDAPKPRTAVVQALFAHAVESVHADLAAASERGALPPRVSVRSLSPLPGTTSFVVDVRPEPDGESGASGARFRPIAIDRVLVRMTDGAVGNRPVDGVNARERLRPTTVEMLAEAYSPVLHRPTPRYPAPRMCGSADEAVDLLTRLLL